MAACAGIFVLTAGWDNLWKKFEQGNQDAVRRHMRIYVNREQMRRLDVALAPGDEVMIVQALSGG